jgi:hypothetical protein
MSDTFVKAMVYKTYVKGLQVPSGIYLLSMGSNWYAYNPFWTHFWT